MTSAPPGKNGGIVFGKITSATMPSASRSRSATVGVPVALAEVAQEVGEQDLVAVDPGVELVVVLAGEEVAVLVDLATAVAVGGDDDVAVVGVHALPPPGAAVTVIVNSHGRFRFAVPPSGHGSAASQ